MASQEANTEIQEIQWHATLGAARIGYLISEGRYADAADRAVDLIGEEVDAEALRLAWQRRLVQRRLAQMHGHRRQATTCLRDELLAEELVAIRQRRR